MSKNKKQKKDQVIIKKEGKKNDFSFDVVNKDTV